MKFKLAPAYLAGFLLISAGCENSSVADTGKAASAPAAPAPAAAQDANNPVLVTVNGQTINAQMFNLYLASRAQTMKGDINSPEVKNQAINELINVLILAQEGKKNGLESLDEVQTAIELKRLEIISRAMLAKVARDAKPSEDELKIAYEKKFSQSSGLEYRASHILVQSEEQAKDLINQIADGGDFAELAKTHSTGPTGKNGGDLGWFDAGQMVKPFSDAVAAMQAGESSKTPVKTKFGWHVIKLVESRDKQPPSFEAVRKSLETDVQRKALTTTVNDLRDGSDVVVNEALAKKQPEAQ